MSASLSLGTVPRIIWRTIGWPCCRLCLVPTGDGALGPAVPWSCWRRLAPRIWGLLGTPLWRAEEEASRRIAGSDVLGGLYQIDEFTGFAATPLTLLSVAALLVRKPPRAILELGSGLSTRLFARHAQRVALSGRRPPRVVSVDHDQEWLERTRDGLARMNLDRFVELVHAPLEEIKEFEFRGICYRPAALAHYHDVCFDFCLIDGPPGSVGRAGCLPLVRPYLAEKALLLLDDAARPGEQEAIRRWQEAFGGRIQKLACLMTSRGLAMFRWAETNSGQCPAAAEER